jgi:tetratricopeptide (TPR) repeat protein
MIANFLQCKGLSEDDARVRLRSELANWTTDRREIGSLAEVTAAMVCGTDDSGDASSATKRYATLTRVMKLASGHRPILLWFDDVQWAPDTLGFVEFLLSPATRRSIPILILLTVSDDKLDEAMEDRLRGLVRRTDVTSLTLGALGTADHQQLVDELLALEPNLASRVVSWTAGNPLLAFKLVGSWVRRGVLEHSPEGYHLRAGELVARPPESGAPGSAIERMLAGARDLRIRDASASAIALLEEREHLLVESGATGSDRRLVLGWLERAATLQDSGDFEASREVVAKAEVAVRDADWTDLLSEVDRLYGQIYVQRGALDDGLAFFFGAYELVREGDDLATRAAIKAAIGEVYRLKGDLEEVRKWVARAIAIYRDTGRKFELAGALTTLGLAVVSAGLFDEGRLHLQEALECFEQVGRSSGVAACRDALAVLPAAGKVA